MTAWPGTRMLAVDTESTGIDVFNDRIVTAYAGYVGGGEPTKGESWLINPGIEIPQGAIDVHGITNEKAAAGRPPAEVIDVLAGEICLAMSRGIPIVGANVAQYDLSLIQQECIRHGLPTLIDRLPVEKWLVIDVMVLDRHIWPYRKGSRKLLDLAKTYAIDLAEADAHGAEADALTAARIAWRMGQAVSEKVAKHLCTEAEVINAYGRVGRMNLVQLMAGQKEWQVERAKSFNAYLKKNNKPADVSPDWPIRLTP